MTLRGSVVQYLGVQLDIRPSALKHGITPEAIAHAIGFPLLVDDEFGDDDTPKVLVLGADAAGNVLEVVGSFDAPDRFTVFHAMAARTGYVQRLERKETR